MHCRQIVLNTMDEVIEFINTTEKCPFSITLKRPGDVSVYDGKSFLSIVILAGWNIEVHYEQKNDALEQVLMKYRVTSMNTGWMDYVFRQHMEESFLTGEADIDAQHIKLLRFFNYLADACERDKHIQARRILYGLKEHVTRHFATEEKMAACYDYPQLEAHRLDHGKLSETVDYLEKMIEKDGGDLPMLTDYVYQEFFPTFFKHIKEYDFGLCEFLKEKEAQNKER